ncbi:response regulator receiver protein [Desulfovibrio sp. X2]|uniref:response regulator n=1 Tax=Desulfovibrio sp. X2 TaxID=941449 RepID=UPI00035883AE|nr:response regulator [Desulfovibrio sp. X2]EPR37379.1 response regulator receiver protein [Desulfovibrio sp. X2]
MNAETEPKVLLVDDEQDFLEVLQKRLQRRGVTVLAAHDGAEALALLPAYDVDVVVLDVKMPGMDGMTVLSRIKAGRPEVEVIMLTGHAEIEAAMQGLEQGAFDYLMKPVEMDHLFYKIQDAYKRKLLRAQDREERAASRESRPDGPQGADRGV